MVLQGQQSIHCSKYAYDIILPLSAHIPTTNNFFCLFFIFAASLRGFTAHIFARHSGAHQVINLGYMSKSLTVACPVQSPGYIITVSKNPATVCTAYNVLNGFHKDT